MSVEAKWNADKEEWLIRERGLSFVLALEAMILGNIVDDIPHPNPARSNQRILVILLEGRHVAVPYVTDGKVKFLKTMYVSRDLDARYGGSNGKTHH
jgi:hypothetical protein